GSAAVAAAPPARPRPAGPPTKDGGDPKGAAVRGGVADADGKPVAGAVVAGYAGLEFGDLSVQYQAKALGEVKTDADGRFRLPVSLAAGERVRRVELLAGARGYGPAWGHAALAAGAEIELPLPPEEAAGGRLIDLQGEPVAGAKLRPVRVLPETPRTTNLPEGKDENTRRMRELMRRQEGFEFRKDSPLKDSPLWPVPVTTDAEGRFRVAGF